MASELSPNFLSDDEEIPQVGPEQFLQAQRRRAVAQALAGQEGSPDDAAEALRLSRVTGVPAPIINVDLDKFKEKHKAALLGDLFENNPRLGDYVNSHPLAAQVSADDWAQLDSFDEAFSKVGQGADSILAKMVKAFGEAEDIEFPEEERKKAERFGIERPAYALYTGAAKVMNFPPALVSALSAGVGELSAQLGFKPGQEAAENIGEAINDPGFWQSIQGIPAAQLAAALFGQKRVLRAHLEAGKVPPPGTDPVIDKIHEEQAKLDDKNLDAARKELLKTSTFQRDPDSAAAFIALHPAGDRSIAISPEGLLKLYGDGRPEPDDGKLGWVRDIQDRYEDAIQTGTDIEVPLKDFLTKADDEAYETLRPYLRHREFGLTLEEAKELQEPKAEVAAAPEVGDLPIDEVRRTAKTPPNGWDLIESEPQRGAMVPKGVGLGPTEFEHQTGDRFTSLGTWRTKDVLPYLDHKDLLPIDRQVLEFFGDQFSRIVGDMPIHVVSNEDWRTMIDQTRALQPDFPRKAPAWYNSYQHHVIVKEDVVNGTYAPWATSHILTHEAAHGLTVHALEQFPEYKDRVTRLMKETRRFMTPGELKEHAYAFRNEKEFLAEAMSKVGLQGVLQRIPATLKVIQDFGLEEKTGTLWDAFKDTLKQLWTKLTGRAPTYSVMDAILRAGEVAEEATKRIDMEEEGLVSRDVAGAEEPTAPETAFGKMTKIMRKDVLTRYLENIKKLQGEDQVLQLKQAEKYERQRQTAEWKANAKPVREEMEQQTLNRLDIAADRFLRTGELPNGQKLRKVRIAEASIPDELRGRLSADYVGSSGVRLDDLASRFGYNSGRTLVESLARLEQERQREGLTPAAHIAKLTDIATEKEMKLRFGDLEENILDAVKDHLVTPTMMDILSDQLQGLGMKVHGEAYNMHQDKMLSWIRQGMEKMNITEVKRDKFIQDMQKNGKLLEKALLEERWEDAFKASQNQFIAAHRAKLAIAVQKLRDRWDKLSAQMREREPSGIDPEYALWAKEILYRIHEDKLVKMHPNDWERQRALTSRHADLKGFVEEENGKGSIWDQNPDAMSTGARVPISDFLLNPDPKTGKPYEKAIADMSLEEFRAVYSAVNVLKTVGKNERTVEIRQKKQDLKEFVGGLRQRLKDAVNGQPAKEDMGHKAMERIGTWVLNPETWIDRLDLGNRLGPFNQSIIRPIMEGQYELRTLERDYGKKLKDLFKGLERLNTRVENPIVDGKPLFMDPRDNFESPMSLTWGNVLAMIQNFGNELQRQKLALGYGIDDPQKIADWLFSITKKEHWDRAQKLGQMFEEIYEKAEQVHGELYGVAPARIELGSIMTPWGEMKEWYHPLIPDPTRHGAKLKPADLLADGNGFHKPATPAGYTKARTGALYPIDLSFKSVPYRMRQMLNDVAMRQGVEAAGKIILDKDFANAFSHYYGSDYQKALVDWLRDVSGQHAYTPGTVAALYRLVGPVLENMNTFLIGWNIGTVIKHAPTAMFLSAREVGQKNFYSTAAKMIFSPDGWKLWKFAAQESEEIQSRLRNMAEMLSGAERRVFMPKDQTVKGQYLRFRDAVNLIGAYPVATSDLFSAKIMWIAAYKQLMEEGYKGQKDLSHGDAVYLANTAVRRTHGSSIIAARPSILRMNPLVSSFQPFILFYNNMLQRSYEGAWQAKLQLDGGRTLSEMKDFEKEQFKFGKDNLKWLVGGIVVTQILPSLIHQLESPLAREEPDDEDMLEPLKYWGKVLARGMPITQIFPGIRDAANYYFGGHDPSMGIWGTAARELAPHWTDKDHVLDEKKFIKNTVGILGVGAGLGYSSLGNAGQFLYNWEKEHEDPDDIWDVLEGLRRGSTREDHPHSFGEWMQRRVEGQPARKHR